MIRDKRAGLTVLAALRAALLLSVLGPIGCVVPPRLSMQAERYHIDIQPDDNHQ